MFQMIKAHVSNTIKLLPLSNLALTEFIWSASEQVPQHTTWLGIIWALINHHLHHLTRPGIWDTVVTGENNFVVIFSDFLWLEWTKPLWHIFVRSSVSVVDPAFVRSEWVERPEIKLCQFHNDWSPTFNLYNLFVSFLKR